MAGGRTTTSRSRSVRSPSSRRSRRSSALRMRRPTGRCRSRPAAADPTDTERRSHVRHADHEAGRHVQEAPLAGKLHPKQVDNALEDMRTALLEADVAVEVADAFLGRVRARALSEEVMKSLTRRSR